MTHHQSYRFKMAYKPNKAIYPNQAKIRLVVGYVQQGWSMNYACGLAGIPPWHWNKWAKVSADIQNLRAVMKEERAKIRQMKRKI